MQSGRAIIIAEAGVNHNGSLDLAREMIERAAHAGADYVKFQTFNSEKLVSRFAVKAEYQTRNCPSRDSSQLAMLKKLEFDARAHQELVAHARRNDIGFLSTAFDMESVELIYSLKLDFWKIASGEITNLPHLQRIGGYRGKVILSTGMADLGEIEDALDVLVEAGTVRENVTILHCNTEYPTPFEHVNLLAMLTIKAAFPGVQVGYSDHTRGIEVPIAAVAMGATIIEKHFTLDRSMEGPDHKASLEPHDLKSMVQAIRNIEKAMGDGIKKPSPSELKNRPVVRKSIVAAREICKGGQITEDNLAVKRAGPGISPMRWTEVIGQRACKDYRRDDLI